MVRLATTPIQPNCQGYANVFMHPHISIHIRVNTFTSLSLSPLYNAAAYSKDNVYGIVYVFILVYVKLYIHIHV